MRPMVWVVAVGAALVAGWSCAAGVFGAEDEVAPTVTPPPAVPDIEIPAIPPVGKDPFQPGEAPKRVDPGPGLVHEGKRIFEREGRFDTGEDGAALFVFASGNEPMRLLENALRQHMEDASQQGMVALSWRVSGLVTVYRGKNYLLLTKAIRVMPEEENL